MVPSTPNNLRIAVEGAGDSAGRNTSKTLYRIAECEKGKASGRGVGAPGRLIQISGGRVITSMIRPLETAPTYERMRCRGTMRRRRASSPQSHRRGGVSKDTQRDIAKAPSSETVAPVLDSPPIQYAEWGVTSTIHPRVRPSSQSPVTKGRQMGIMAGGGDLQYLVALGEMGNDGRMGGQARPGGGSTVETRVEWAGVAGANDRLSGLVDAYLSAGTIDRSLYILSCLGCLEART
ncbi:hypothetical protein DFP72DRAFT_1050221 [Ephemerocybe angulata]|uniref:Uncharacterized protein n=1 Tax=Ephemerocybe angulata TaxID=980116 RepID=A0A8H6HJ61_9AGAR|nr:hypothetical protein DFP72DRAFT_1050221 [Tulosesus angulatus]